MISKSFPTRNTWPDGGMTPFRHAEEADATGGAGH
jgi:hypothetical protein